MAAVHGDPCATATGEERSPTMATTTTLLATGGVSGHSTPGRSSKKRKPGKGRWTSEEHAAFLEGLEKFGKDWLAISKVVKTRTHVQTRTHHQKYLQQMMKGRKFPEEMYAIRGLPISRL